LGVLDIRTHNDVLLLKSLHKFHNRENLPWVNLIWENYYKNGRLPVQLRKDLFGGGIYLNYWTCIKEWHQHTPCLVLPYTSRMTCGMKFSQRLPFLSSTHLSGTKASLCRKLNLCRINCIAYFTSHFLKRLLFNF
jgi:hypothetical protein